MSAPAPDGSAVLERGRPTARRGDAGRSGSRPPGRGETRPAREKKPAGPAAKAERPAARTVLDEEPPHRRRSITEILGVWGLSVLVHVVAGLALTFIIIDSETRDQIFSILGEPGEEPDDAPIFEAIEMPESLDEVEETTEIADVASDNVAEESTEMPLDVNELDPSLALDAADVGQAIRVKLDSATSGRSASAKAALVQKYGGNAASEKAVATGLKWIASKQRQDGSWSFTDIGDDATFDVEGRGDVPDDAEMAATASALLAFLGAGHTHQQRGPYKRTVRAGLDYLISHAAAVERPDGVYADYRGAFEKQGMYVQGLVCIALAEAYGMTKDKDLRTAAEAGLRFIIAAQGPLGGWRYRPAFEVQKFIAEGDPDILGDTSVVGWQLMALKSGVAANIKIDSSVFKGVDNFLDETEWEGGTEYGYQPRRAYQMDEKDGTGRGSVSQTRSAIGLLCRMYLGWKKEDDRLKRGVEKLAEAGPKRNDSYLAYYATQVLHHWGGDLWEEWNAVQREYLVSTQEQAGPLAGSWTPGNSHGDRRGGRLWVTCLSVMTLEVYYRHLPLYERADIQVEF